MREHWDLLGQAADELSIGPLDELATARLVARVRRARARRTWSRIAVAAASVALIGVGGQLALSQVRPEEGTSTPHRSTTPTATPSATGTSTTAGTPWPGRLGSLSQASADDIKGSSPGAALAINESGESEVTNGSVVLVDPASHSVLNVLDLSESPLAHVQVVDLEWSAGQAEARVVYDNSTEATAGTLDLLTGDLTIDQTIPDADAVGLRSDGALVAITHGRRVVVAESGGVRELGTQRSLSLRFVEGLAALIDPSGTYMAVNMDDEHGYQVMNLMTGALTDLGDGVSGRFAGWVDDGKLVLSYSASTTDYPGGFGGPTDQDGAVKLTVDVSDGATVERTSLGAGDPWVVRVFSLGDGRAVASGWPLPTASEAQTWKGGDEESMKLIAEHYCQSHVYSGSWADGVTEAEVVGDWPLMVLGGSGRYSYVETNAGACESVPTPGPLEVHDSDAGTTTTVLLPDDASMGMWLLFPMES